MPCFLRLGKLFESYLFTDCLELIVVQLESMRIGKINPSIYFNCEGIMIFLVFMIETYSGFCMRSPNYGKDYVFA